MIERLDLHALADGELNKAEAKQLRQALTDDPQAQGEYEFILSFKEMVRDRSVRHEADDCWKSCVGRLDEIDRSRRVESFVSRYAWAMCAVFFVLILGSRFMVNDVRGASARTADLGQIFGLGHSSQPSISAEQQRTYNWIFDNARHVADPNRIRLQSTSMDVFQDYRVSHFNLVDGRGSLALFVIPALVNFEDTAELPTEPGVFAGVIPTVNPNAGQASCLVWHRGPNTMVLAGQRSAQELEDVRTQLAP